MNNSFHKWNIMIRMIINLHKISSASHLNISYAFHMEEIFQPDQFIYIDETSSPAAELQLQNQDPWTYNITDYITQNIKLSSIESDYHSLENNSTSLQANINSKPDDNINLPKCTYVILYCAFALLFLLGILLYDALFGHLNTGMQQVRSQKAAPAPVPVLTLINIDEDAESDDEFEEEFEELDKNDLHRYSKKRTKIYNDNDEISSCQSPRKRQKTQTLMAPEPPVVNVNVACSVDLNKMKSSSCSNLKRLADPYSEEWNGLNPDNYMWYDDVPDGECDDDEELSLKDRRIQYLVVMAIENEYIDIIDLTYQQNELLLLYQQAIANF